MNRQRLFSDEEIVAYLDDTLENEELQNIERALENDIELRKRVESMSFDKELLRDSFEPLLQDAPPIDLSTPPDAGSMTGIEVDDHAGQMEKPVVPASKTRDHRSNRWIPAAAAAMLVVTVAAFSYMAGTKSQHDSTQIKDWRIAVADYQRLYVSETLPQESPDLASRLEQLQRVSEASEFAVTDAMIELPNLSFRRAQILGVGEQPLTQLVFATTNGEPVALCFTAEPGEKMRPRTDRIYDMNMVSWRNENMGFVLMGRVSEELLDETAAEAAAVF